MHLLCIDACPRGRAVSRTWRLAEAFLSEYEKTLPHASVTVLRLADEPMAPFHKEDLLHREALIDSGELHHPMFRWANDFAKADHLAVAAPYWDLSFPAILKIYMENIFVRNITFRYTKAGEPVGLCRAQRLVYLTTAGSPIWENDWGYAYIRAATKMLGVKNFGRVSAEGIDIQGRDTEAILQEAMEDARLAVRAFAAPQNRHAQ